MTKRQAGVTPEALQSVKMSRLMGAIARFPPICNYAGKRELFNRVVAGGLKTLNTEERQLVEQSRRNRRKALRQAGVTHDPLTQKPLKP